MSAFLVEDKTINSILTAIRPILRDYVNYDDENSRELLLLEFDSDTWAAKLGQKMFDFNLEALGERYESTLTDWRTDGKGYAYQPEYTSQIQAIKSFGCFLYQCCEGDIPKKPFYKALKWAKDHLTETFIMSLPEYNLADWN
jgi:hypothetical protein